MKITIGILFFAIGNILAWFQYNSQFAWEWWEDKPFLPNIIYGIPVGVCFWYAIKNIVEASNELWMSKLIGFGVSNFIFAILTYFFLRESIFTPKTMVCLLLASMIIGIQIFWK